MPRKPWPALAILAVIALGCDVRPVPEAGPFTVTVRTSQGLPLEGAVIEGGIDWDYFWIETDADGRAELPSSAWDQEAVIHLDNYFPERVTLNRPYLYDLAPTPQRLRLLGAVEGEAVLFAPGRVATVEYQGTYHLYALDDNGLTETGTMEFPGSVTQTRVVGDTLWFSTYRDGIFAYSLADPEHPREELHLALPGVSRAFALSGGMVVTAGENETSPLRAYLFQADGSFVETARFGDFYVASVDLIGGYLVASGYNEAHPRIYALDDPYHPVLVYESDEPEYWSGFVHGRQYVQVPRPDSVSENTGHGRLDLTDPAHPVKIGTFRTDSRLVAVVDDATAVGYYHVMCNALSVQKRGPTTGFRTAAIVSEDPRYDLNLFGGCAPPYFVIGDRLWILEDRISP